MSIEDRIILGDHAMGVVRSCDGTATGFTESPDSGKAASADQRDDGLIDFSFIGMPPQNEEDSLTACRTLVLAFNLAGDDWDPPCEGSGDEVDCWALSKARRDRLEIQVVRALCEEDFWRAAGLDLRVEKLSVKPSELAAQLRRAVELKTDKRPIPPAQRTTLTLALDARRTPALAFDAVVKAFKAHHGAWAASHGFASIWLVGPTPQLCWRLDS